jgi:N-acetylglutamate synthase-like GNAT family acetyltransferase
MSEVTIRQMKAEDSEKIAQLSKQLGYPASPEQMQSRISCIIDSQQDRVFVAVSEDSVVVGWIHVFATMRLESEPFAEIGGIVVDSNYRNRGIGKSLIECAEQWAAQKNLTKLRVRSRTSRNSAHCFFKISGFIQSKTQHVFDKPLENKEQ